MYGLGVSDGGITLSDGDGDPEGDDEGELDLLGVGVPVGDGESLGGITKGLEEGLIDGFGDLLSEELKDGETGSLET